MREVHITCKRVECVNYQWGVIGGWGCFGRSIIIDEKGKCTSYTKDTPENIRLARANKDKK